MKTTTTLLFLIIAFYSCTDTYYDKGKEYQVVESSTTTPFKNKEFETNESCKECHFTIYNEFVNSMHYKATVFRDSIHDAVWKEHPNFKNNEQYTCAQCHLPGADNIEAFMQGKEKQFPDIKNKSQNEAVSCASCHRIKSIEQHRKSNRNIYNDDKLAYYGIISGTGLAHQIKSDNKMYYNAALCLGCHSHRENIKEYVVCITDSKTAQKSFDNCITCHMPTVPGSGSANVNHQKHFYHGFPGVHNDAKMLNKHVEFSIVKENNSQIDLHINNKAPHDLFLHPLRMSFLKMTLIRDSKKIKTFDTLKMQRVLENNKGIAGCTTATKETENSLLQGDTEIMISLEYDFRTNDILEVEIGYVLVKDQFVKPLHLEDYKAATSYKLFKKEQLLIK